MFQREPEEQGELPPSLDGLKVLIVDDDPGVRSTLTEFVERADGRATAVATLAAARAALDAMHYDVLAADRRLPDGDGLWNLLLAVRRDRLARVGLSAFYDGVTQVAVQEAGAVVLAKPFRGPTFVRAVLEACRRAQVRAHRRARMIEETARSRPALHRVVGSALGSGLPLALCCGAAFLGCSNDGSMADALGDAGGSHASDGGGASPGGTGGAPGGTGGVTGGLPGSGGVYGPPPVCEPRDDGDLCFACQLERCCNIGGFREALGCWPDPESGSESCYDRFLPEMQTCFEAHVDEGTTDSSIDIIGRCMCELWYSPEAGGLPCRGPLESSPGADGPADNFISCLISPDLPAWSGDAEDDAGSGDSGTCLEECFPR